jgi:hypothetical protein
VLEVAGRIVELLAQVILAHRLVLMVDGLDGREQAGPRARLAGSQRPPAEFRL